jgi:hypothetical protein
MELILSGLLIMMIVCAFLAGYGFARATQSDQQPRGKPPDEQQTILVKRNRTSFRNPAKTNKSTYDEYKTSKGLYAPVKPGKGSTADDIDLNSRGRR